MKSMRIITVIIAFILVFVFALCVFATAADTNKQSHTVETARGSDEMNESNINTLESVDSVASPLEKGYISEETLSKIYDSSVLQDIPLTSLHQRSEPVERNVLEYAEIRNIDENYCYSVYETENGGTLFAFFLREDTSFEKNKYAGQKEYIQYLAYVEKPMKMSDFDLLKAGDTIDEIIRIDPGSRYHKITSFSLHLCVDGLVVIEYNGPKIFAVHKLPDSCYTVFTGVVDAVLAGLVYENADGEQVMGDDFIANRDLSIFNPYFTLKIDPADYPQE